jgi:FtsP/CotA-like multicopper oxidase with cupredoxin domain
MDGVPGLSGDSGNIAPGQSFTYSFIARPAGTYPYHCHMDPLIVHLNHGLYGVMIIDRPVSAALPPAQEMVILLNGYSLQLAANNGSALAPHLPTIADANTLLKGGSVEGGGEPENNIYTANGIAFYYYQHPINMTVNTLYRVYLVNMLDFDLLNTFHLHGSLFKWYPSGTNTTEAMTTDIVSLTQGDRGYMEFSFLYPGKYMIHSHLADQSDKGWMGFLDVKGGESAQTSSDNSGKCSGSNCR